MKRAHESKEHIAMKSKAGRLFRKCGWIVLFEVKCVDMTAFRPGNATVWAVEFERSAKWVERNGRKAAALGVAGLLIVANTDRVAAKAERIVARMKLAVKRVLITTTDNLDEEFIHVRMEQ
jgi:hypothetical protein